MMTNSNSDPEDELISDLSLPKSDDAETPTAPEGFPDPAPLALWVKKSEPLSAKIGRYRVVDLLGEGTYGVVFRAMDELLHRHVALKLLTRFEDAKQIDAWLAEARVLAGIDHASIVPVFDVGKTDAGQPYIVSKLIDGGSLSRRFVKGGCSVDDAVRLVGQLANALDYLHRRGIMHRDVKPANILTTAEGNAVLTDFGLALSESDFGKGARFVGTPAYMSPEQARFEGHRVDGRSDIYSLGVVFYELLTGSRPFRADNQEDLLDCIRNVEVRPLRQLNSTVPKELERICMKALSKKITDRYSTAKDLVDDLKNWETVSRTTTTSVVSPVPETPTSSPKLLSTAGVIDTQPSAKSLDLEHVAVVPHGLRPFNANDADFFKYLIPGARDRNGTPESVNFWTNRILQRDPNETFRVGVLLGPSGSGKSSLIRAGVLPLVESSTLVITADARPEALEASLLKQLHSKIPSSKSFGTLRESLVHIRQQTKERQNPKLLLVIDQFEQWLNHNRSDRATELHEALRQCDGANVQAILIVRDDFMLGISSFMDQLEELMLQNQNFATVEPFGLAHAKRVLAAFGRAYGTLNDPATAEQDSFLNEATNELSRIGKLEPVQIALLSEMIKDKPWTPSTFRALGGIQGLGVSFMAERLTGSSAHPLLRTHSQAVQRILAEMLPSDDTVIKPPACTQSVLIEKLAGVVDQDMLSKLLNLLDTEVRLITPTSNFNNESGSAMGSASTDHAYQLTHDFLVATTRKWLASHDTESRSGRVRNQMREMAATWNATPTAKRLPTFFEWAAMRWYVASTHWTAPEKKMMHAVQSRLRKAGTISLVVASVAGAFSYYTYCDMKSQTFATRLIEADTGDVSAILREMEPYRNWTLPKLAKWPSSIDTEDEQTTARRKLHLELAQLGSDPENVTNLLRQLHVIDDRHIGSIIQYLKSSPTLDDSLVAKELRSATIEKSQSALPIAALLAQRVPDHPEWPTYASSLSDALIKRRGAQLGNWIELLLPIRNHLLPAILSQGESADEDNQKIDNLTTIAAAFAFDDPASLGKAITWAPIEQIPELIKNNPTREKLAVVLREILTTNTNPIPSQHRMVSPAALAILDRYNGQAIGSAAWMYRVPWSEVQPTLKQLQPDGFQPVSIRPYQSDASRFACIALQRGQAKILFEDGLSEENFHSRFQERQDQGAELIDFAEYPEILNASTADHARSTAPPKYLWAGLWRFRESESESTTQYLRLNETFPQAQMGEFKSNGYIPSRYATRLNASGDLLHSCVWTRQDMENSQFNIWSRFEYASGDLFPGCYQCDLRSEPIEHGVDRSEIWTDYYQLLDDIGPSRRPSPRETVNLASRLSAVGQYQNALQLLETFTDADYANDPKGKAAVLRGAKRQYARAFARQKDGGKLKEWLASADQFGPFDPSEIHYLEFRLAVIEQSGTTAKEKLDSLLSITDTSPLVEDFCLRALAIAAQSSLPELQNASAFEKLLQRIPIAIAESKIKEIQITLMEVEFDGLMHRPEWRSLLEKLQLTSRFTNSNYARAEAVSKTIFSLPQLDHAIESQKLANQGYIPTSIHAYPNNQGNLVISSAWELLETNNAIRGKTSRQNGTIALALAKIGERDALLDALQGKWGRATQSFVVTQAHKILPPEPFVTLLKESTTAKLLPTLVSVVGSYRPNEMNESTFQYLKLRLSEWANTANDAALMAQSRWCLSQWGEPAGELQPSSTAQPERNWLVTKHGHQLVVLKPPKMVLVGEDLWRMWKRMDRNFAIGTTEVTGKQYAEFLSDPRVQKWISQERTERASPLSPQTYAQSGVSWQHAIRYCQWLNELEGVPEDQWCYKDVWNEEGLPITPYPNYTSRLGYRLPTGAEWEYACSAGSDASWHFGSDGQLAKHFEWTSPHAGNQPHEVATLRPNAFGLFDMGGNLAEWTDDFYLPPKRASNQYFTYDSGNKPTDDGTYCNLRTARFNLLPQSSTSFAFRKTLSSYLTGSTGFRIARTILTDD